MDYLRGEHMLCLTVTELKQVLARKFKSDLLNKLVEQEINLDSLRGNLDAMKQLSSEIISSYKSNKEVVEFFVAANIAESVYKSPDTKIGFELKDSVILRELSNISFNELKEIIVESTMTDFAIISNNELRKFQLKQQKEDLTTDAVAKELEKVVQSYYGSIGNHNVILILQGDRTPDDGEILQINIDCEVIHNKLNTLNIMGSGEILLSLNEENEKEVLIQVFPELNRFETKHVFSSEYWNIEHL